MNRVSFPHIVKRRQRGFSMIEVLVALVVLSIGLLGLALLQTMNLRFTQSANQRTIAVNLAYELLDYVRANRRDLTDYVQITPGSFSAVTVPATGCARTGAMTPAANMARWRCEVREALGPDAEAAFSLPAAGGVRIDVTWDDEPWNNQNATYTLVTTI